MAVLGFGVVVSALPPHVLELRRRQFGTAHRVGDRLVPEPILNEPRVMASIGQREAAAVAQHVRVDAEDCRAA